MEETTNQDSQTPGTFTDYRKVLANLVSDLKSLQEYCQKLKLDKSIPIIEDVLERVQTNSFSLAVVGEFKRGKSTFINALLGQEILPADVNPCSATLNRVTSGVREFVKVIFKDGREEEIAIDKLADYVTKLTPESEETAANVKEAVVYHPVHYCQNNVDIIDTPGLNDDEGMTEVTLSVLPQVDAAIMVIMAQVPFGESERKFLETKLLTNDLGRIIFVVTGIDRYNNPEEAQRGVKFIQDRIKNSVIKRAKAQYGEDSPEYEVYRKKIGEPKVFGISAYQALQAKRNSDTELMEKSRFGEFEAALEKFLTQERGATFLQVPVNRTIASASEIIQTIKLKKNALAMDQEKFIGVYEKSVADIKELQERSAKELKLIDVAAEKVKNSVQPIVDLLENELKQAAETVIELEFVTLTQLRNKRAVSEKLGHKVSDAVQQAAQKQAEKIQNEVELGLLKEVNRLEEFAHSIDGVLQNIEMQFLSIDAAPTHRKDDTGESVVAAIAMATFGLGGAWMGYRQAGIKGAAVGAAGGFSTAVAGLVVASMMGLPFTFPVAIVVSVVSMITGGELVKMVFAGEQVESFKESYKKAVWQEIEKQLRDNRIERKVDEHISEIFYNLKQNLRQEVDSLLDNTQNQLFELYAERERKETMSEQECQELEEMAKKTQRILDNAQRLSQELIQQVNISEPS